MLAFFFFPCLCFSSDECRLGKKWGCFFLASRLGLQSVRSRNALLLRNMVTRKKFYVTFHWNNKSVSSRNGRKNPTYDLCRLNILSKQEESFWWAKDDNLNNFALANIDVTFRWIMVLSKRTNFILKVILTSFLNSFTNT